MTRPLQYSDATCFLFIPPCSLAAIATPLFLIFPLRRTRAAASRSAARSGLSLIRRLALCYFYLYLFSGALDCLFVLYCGWCEAAASCPRALFA